VPAPHQSPEAQGVDVVVVGGSAGALEGLVTALSPLPENYPLPIAVVVHLAPSDPSALARVLAARCALRVLEAEDKAPALPGTIYVAVPRYHLLLDSGPSLALSVDDPVNFSIPSIDVLFESATLACGGRVAGVVLSGANEDGAAGLAAIRAMGGVAVVQTPAEAPVDTMPRAAMRRCPEAAVLTAVEIARLLLTLPSGFAP